MSTQTVPMPDRLLLRADRIRMEELEPSMTTSTLPVIGGINTHKHTHYAAGAYQRVADVWDWSPRDARPATVHRSEL